ncbi:hypothetical protein LTR70_007055 [Exophiala xenobiotica]|uniref:Uncharacterized protein n=1 Tax=Lithohypha guttulata TaxID=1690604 RepID=A0ABR0K6Y2_9EURO|nr:hypothetical protein LTR24_006627 [Lithohypha guttulata]KAK5314693.1 hypothetical protein LTR70_007055 [Exophiala xenobiotica]
MNPQRIRNIRLSAALADFAYAAGNPQMTVSIDNTIAQGILPENIATLLPSHTIVGFTRLNSRFYFNTFGEQHRWFRSTAYFWHLRTPRSSDKIFVGFRGTFPHPGSPGRDIDRHGPTATSQTRFSKLVNRLLDFAPSNYGLADFYHDATVIRIPYRKGTVWKWYSFWGSLILGRTPGFLGWPRTVAAHWMSCPYDDPITDRVNGHVHLDVPT